jgi:conjugal transfer ATP-binding protein TraC
MFNKNNQTTTPPTTRNDSSVPDMIAPSSVEIDFNTIKVGERFYKTLFVVGYPRFVSPDWLEP